MYLRHDRAILYTGFYGTETIFQFSIGYLKKEEGDRREERGNRGRDANLLPNRGRDANLLP